MMRSYEKRTICRYVIAVFIFLALISLWRWCLVCTPSMDFVTALHNTASSDGSVLLSYVDCGYVDLAINFYETSLRPHGIENFLFVSTSVSCCRQLGALPCFVYGNEDNTAATASLFGAPSFKHKMNRRSEMIAVALTAGFTVLHSDTDVVFFSDPLPLLARQSAHVSALLEASDYNAGFIHIRPTPLTQMLYTRMCQMADHHPEISDQRHLNNALNLLRGAYERQFSVVGLPLDQFQFGGRYFEDGGRMFAGDSPCPDCIVVHNNWMVTKAAKIYRFKEHLMWTGDHGAYYSDARRKYVQYNNPTLFKDDNVTAVMEREALRSALAIASVLNRTLILPAFHCNQTKLCALNSHYSIEAFDAAFHYREHVFLQNPLVPNSVKRSLSPFYLVTIANHMHQSDTVTLVPDDTTRGATSDEIMQWFGHKTESVLRFRSLYSAFSHFSNSQANSAFNRLLTKGLKMATYRQDGNSSQSYY